MAKLAFTKLGLKPNNTVNIINFNELTIEVKEYLAVNDKLAIISNVINNAIDNNGYYNEGKIRVYFALEIIYAYTNLSFTDKQKEDECKLYDLLVGNGLWNKIWNMIPSNEQQYLTECLYETIKSIYNYKNSVMGILDTVAQDYSNLSLDALGIKQDLADPNNLTLLRDVLTKLG